MGSPETCLQTAESFLDERCGECERRDLCEKLAERNRFEGAVEMAGAVAHELNQILQQFLGYSDLISWEAQELSQLFEVEKSAASTVVPEAKLPEFQVVHRQEEIIGNLRNLSGKLSSAADKMGKFAWKVAMIREYRTKEYLPGRRMIDIDYSTGFNEGSFPDNFNDQI